MGIMARFPNEGKIQLQSPIQKELAIYLGTKILGQQDEEHRFPVVFGFVEQVENKLGFMLQSFDVQSMHPTFE